MFSKSNIASKTIEYELNSNNNSYFVRKGHEMNIQAEKIELAKLLLDTNDPKIIQSIKEIFRKENNFDIWDELTIDQKKEIDTARKEIKEGKSSDYESFMSKHK